MIVFVPFRGISFLNACAENSKLYKYAFSSPSRASHFSIRTVSRLQYGRKSVLVPFRGISFLNSNPARYRAAVFIPFSSPSGASHFSIPQSISFLFNTEQFSSPSGASHFSIRALLHTNKVRESSRPLPGHLISQFLSLTPHILSGLAGYFAWENQIEAIFHSQTASKSLQTQYLSHARENTPYRRFSFLLTPVHQYLLQSPNIRLYRRILTIIIIIALSEYFKSHLPACFNRRIPCSLLRRIS